MKPYQNHNNNEYHNGGEKAMYYTFKDNRSTEFSVYMPTETEAEIFANRNYLIIIDKRNTETF